MPVDRLRERGIVSLAINNAAGYAPVTAWTFSDPQYKFHHGVFLDPKVITFSPTPKLGKHLRYKHPSGEFQFTDLRVCDCPNSWGYGRRTMLDVETFLTDDCAHWGWGGKQGEDRSFSALNTMFLGLRLLHYMGVRTIYLLGVDFQREPDQFYAWDQDKGGGGSWQKSIKLLSRLKPHFQDRGLKLFNCNPQSALEVFDHVDFGSAMEHCRGMVPAEPLDLAGWYNKGPVRDDREAIKAGTYEYFPLQASLDRPHPPAVPYDDSRK